MDNDNSTPQVEQPAEVADATAQPRPHRLGNLIATVGLLICIASWIAMVHNESLSAALGAAALCMAVAGCFMARRGMWRDIAITALIASGVLLLVLAAFTYGLDLLVSSLS